MRDFLRLRRPIRLISAIAALAISSLVVTGCDGAKSAVSSRQPTVTTGPSAATLQQQFVAVVRRVPPQVAQIETDRGLGSGVILDANGDIVTNAHVVAGAGTLRVTLADGRRFPARLVGAYTPDDLAVVSIGAGHAIKPATFADSSKVDVGNLVLAVGNPLRIERLLGSASRITPPGPVQWSPPCRPVVPPTGPVSGWGIRSRRSTANV